MSPPRDGPHTVVHDLGETFFLWPPVYSFAIIGLRPLNDDPIAVLRQQFLASLMGQDYIPCFFHPAQEILFLVMLLSMGGSPIFVGGLSGRGIEFELAVAADEGREDRRHLIDMMKLILSKGQH